MILRVDRQPPWSRLADRTTTDISGAAQELIIRFGWYQPPPQLVGDYLTPKIPRLVPAVILRNFVHPEMLHHLGPG